MTVKRSMDIAGAVALAGCLFHMGLSWFLASGHTRAYGIQENSSNFTAAIARAFGWLPDGLENALATGGPFQDMAVMSAVYAAPLILQTLCALALLWALRRAGEDDLAGPALARRAGLWAAAFAVSGVLASTVLTQDIWLSIPWGRMALLGQDPYLAAFAPALATDVPLDYPPIPMTYGPLWAAISALAVALSGDTPMLAWLLLKLVLLAGWLLVLKAVYEISAGDGRRQAYAMALVGWLPIGYHSVVAEGHTDGLMMGLFLLWLVWMNRAGARAPLAFLAATMTKYIVAPVVIVDAIYFLRTGTLSLRQYILRALPAVVIAVPLGAYLLTGGRLEGTVVMKDWNFLALYDLLRIAEVVTGLSLPKLWLPRLIFAGIAGWSLYQLWKRPDAEHVWLASLCILSALLFTGVGHVWPWFYVWVLPVAALVPGTLMARFALGACLVAPFSILPYSLVQMVFGAQAQAEGSLVESLMVYGCAFAVLGFAVLRRWRGGDLVRGGSRRVH